MLLRTLETPRDVDRGGAEVSADAGIIWLDMCN